jgi:RNA-directed DNA polymerase
VNVDEMQKKLSQKAEKEPEHPFENLYGLLCNKTWLRVAHHTVNTNAGRETAGIDGESMRNFNGDLEGNLEALRQLLKAKSFEPQPVRRVYIPKPDGRKRPLGIPGIRDRIVQEALRMILDPIWEADFSVHSYGFRPNRNTYDAMAYLRNRLVGSAGKGYQWVIEGDITSYFDTIPHRRLIKAIKKRVADRNTRDLIWKFLRAGVMYKGALTETLTGTPQGGIISPLLANIYLHEMDKYMESNYLNISKLERNKRRKAGKGNYLYTRYADDFVILCNGTKAEARQMKEEIGGLLRNMRLTLSEEKTQITHITEGFTFLGYEIIKRTGIHGKMVPKVLVPKKAIKKFQDKLKAILAPGTMQESLAAKIAAVNALTRGWCNYYRNTSRPSQDFNQLRPKVFWGMAHWIGKKYKVNMPEVMRRYRKGDTLTTKTMTLVMPTEYKARKLFTKHWHNPYTEKEKIVRERLFSLHNLWSGHEENRGWMDQREEVIRLKGTICALNLPDICESKGKPLHPSEVEIHHATKPRAQFKDKTEADRMKHLQPVCTSCHRAQTKVDLKVLSRVR